MPSLAGLAERLRGFVFIALERTLPVKRNYWCFCAWPGDYPHTLDNPRAVFEQVKDDASIVKVILVRRPLKECSPSTVEGARVIVVHAETLRGAYYLSVSRVVLIGYGLVAMSSYSKYLTTKHKIVQLWHGIPLKRIGKLFPGESVWDTETYKYAATVCSSGPDHAIMSQAFAPIPEADVWQTGLPRNDLILKQEAELPADYRKQLDRLREQLAGRRLVLYAPTWRERGPGMYEFSDDERDRLATLLAENGAVLGIRGHSNVRSRLPDARQPASNGIIHLNDYPDVNLVLRVTDVLVTDYSSLYIDFLLLDRPILHFTYDIDAYVAERGFLYELDEALASPHFCRFDELLTQLDAVLGRGIVQRDWHARSKRLFHDHAQHSASAVAERIHALSAAPAGG